MNDDDQLDQKPLDILLQLLLQSAAAAAAQHYHVRNKARHRLEAWYDIITKTAKKLHERMEAREQEAAAKKDVGVEVAAAKQQTVLEYAQYERVLRQVFPVISNSKKPLQAQEQDTKQATSTTAMVEDQIKEMIHKVTENARGAARRQI
uniref:Uncharacterized protein n=1 Tax=Arundo donax TaxID=35708 RepID=A0A0A8ZHJ5_ARUDO